MYEKAASAEAATTSKSFSFYLSYPEQLDT
jgi:hypothetical protein